MKLTLASLNTFGGNPNIFNLASRYGAITKYFVSSEVDIINFQEVFSYYHLQLLKSLVKSHPFCLYQKSYFGPKGGLVTFSRLPLENLRYVNYIRRHVPYFVDDSIIELFTQRGALTAEVKGQNIMVINTHLTAVLNGDWSQSSKYYPELVSEISQFHQLVKSERLIVASGDFNIAKNTDLYQQLIDLSLLTDPFENDLAPTRHQCFARSGRKTNCVDYIFIVGDKFRRIEQSRRIFTDKVVLANGQFDYASDHIGLETTIKID